MTKKIRISFGTLSAPLFKQLKVQGMPYNKEVLKECELDIKAVVRLNSRGLLSDEKRDLAYKGVFNRIERHINEFD